MPTYDWFRRPRSVLVLYLVGATTALACLTWLGVRQLAQDQLIESARLRLEGFADRAVAASQQHLNELERAVTGEAAAVPADTVVVVGDESTIRVVAGPPLVFQPMPLPSTATPADAFLAAETAEFGAAGLASAADAYRTLAANPQRGVQAGALIRLGRVLRQLRQYPAALEAYDALARLADVVIESRPADLWARLGRCRVFEESDAQSDLEREAQALRHDLARGRWQVTTAVWDSLYSDVTTLAGASATAIDGLENDRAVAEALDYFWRQLRAKPPSPQLVNAMPGPVLVVWSKQKSAWRAIFAGPRRVEAIARQINVDPAFTIVLSDQQTGRSIGGRPQTAPVRRAAGETGLPWNLAVDDADPAQAAALVRGRRLTFVGALVLVSLLIVISGYFTFRGIRRELDTARQQAEFVSAVSHEFRTPLTSIRQLSHMLHGGRVQDEVKRGQYYDVLVRESERLHRLIERLLSLGRAEARRYRFESTDACELAKAVVTDFRNRDRERSIELVLAASPCQLQADREMLALAVWNLLENAAKYSPHNRPVRVAVSTSNGQIAIAVQDEGAGIPPEDRVRIFEQFVRGADRDVAGTPGTGLGLALVDRVVRAHGGTVQLDSELGHGSSFTILIPTEQAA